MVTLVVTKMVTKIFKALLLAGFGAKVRIFESPVSHTLETLGNTQFQGFSLFQKWSPPQN